MFSSVEAALASAAEAVAVPVVAVLAAACCMAASSMASSSIIASSDDLNHAPARCPSRFHRAGVLYASMTLTTIIRVNPEPVAPSS